MTHTMAVDRFTEARSHQLELTRLGHLRGPSAMMPTTHWTTRADRSILPNMRLRLRSSGMAWLIALAAIGATVMACRSSEPTRPPMRAEREAPARSASGPGASFEVRKDGELIAVVTDAPGIVFQRGAPPPLPGAPPPPTRPFSLEAYALTPGPGVADAIEQAPSAADLLRRLEALGYTIVEAGS